MQTINPGVSPTALTSENRESHTEVFKHLIDVCVDFKLQDQIYRQRRSPEQIRDILVRELPEHPTDLAEIIDDFRHSVLPLCKNENSPYFLGFGDTGDDPAALAGGLLALFTQQNLINQSFDSPSATFVEIATLRWLRELLGYTNLPVPDLTCVWNVGGLVTTGGTSSNTVAMMLAREQRAPGCMVRGVSDPGQFGVIVPRGIGHYSVRSALTWIGCGAQIIEVDTIDFRYDLQALKRTLHEHKGRVMSVVAYAGDSRTQTIENLRAVHDVVRSTDESIWLHADACWGFVCTFSEALRPRVDGIAEYDSVTVDPHKVMAVPYSVSALLVKVPEHLRMITSYSDLIMQEDFAFGQITPFIGTKPWASLKLWMMMRAHGRAGLAAMIERRMEITRAFVEAVDQRPRFLRLHDPDLTAVAFLYLPTDVDPTRPDIDRVNTVNKEIHRRLLEVGQWHLHQFSIPDPGVLRTGEILHPLRFMGANLRIEERHIGGILGHVQALGADIEESC
ncbi:pyridoxal-dependent decarboxylase [Micromonospora sp. NPDC050695]|uniref:pyridoxal phosphate-dependent decarboxylase family protein n=1 Tax=Micromonospora sp. NPDC050695 TaxID=3154938 RepID=UPI0033FF0592